VGFKYGKEYEQKTLTTTPLFLILIMLLASLMGYSTGHYKGLKEVEYWRDREIKELRDIIDIRERQIKTMRKIIDNNNNNLKQND
jgi:hypothetical protein